MKYLSLPINLLIFWYPQSFLFWLRTWKNTILYLEEDLAVWLMFKLIFVPLFHDSTILGRILSFFFRCFRIFIGLTALLIVSGLVIVLGIGWFLLPVLVFISPEPYNFLARFLTVSGVTFFIYHNICHPPKKLWQLGLRVGSLQNIEKIWQSSFIKKRDYQFPELLKTYQVKQLLVYLEQDPKNFAQITPAYSPEALLKTIEIGSKLGLDFLSPEHFFVGLLSQVPNIDKYLLKLGLKFDDFIEALDFLKKREELWRVVWIFDEDFSVRHLKGVNRGWLGVPTPNLDLVSEDLTRKAARNYLPDFIGRSDVVNRVIDLLSLERGRNVIIVGEAGSGKTTLVDFLAKMIVRGDAPISFATKRLVRLDFTKLLAGVNSQGELAEKINNVFEEMRYSGEIVLFVDEIENLGIGEAGTQYNLYSLILPFIEDVGFQFIATTDPSSYTKVLEKDPSFARLFNKIELPPASTFETVEIIKRQAIQYERFKKVKTTLLATRKIVDLTKEYIHDRVLPDAALQVYQECLVKAENGWIKEKIVEDVLQSRIRIPIGKIKEEQRQQLLNLESIIHKKLVDQQEAVEVVCNTLRRAAANLREKERPIGSFLFVGPTGVGKTELSKILADIYFEGRGQFLRFDMSEYQTPESLDKLIGKVGEEGYLTEGVRHNPYSLILLDEFEKADYKILNLFLQVLEDGRLTDGTGRTVDFTNTIIIATSNAGSLTIAQGLSGGQSLDLLKDKVNEELLQVFKPELINRFDEVVLFKPLSPDDLQKIVRLKLNSLQNQLKEQGYLVDFADQLVSKLSQKGFDPKFGARPLRRLIQDTLEARLSVMILEGKLPKGEKFLAEVKLLEQY